MRTRWTTWALALLALIFLSIGTLPAIAQSTGSSFGGGSFGGGGSYSGGSSSYSSSSSSYSSSSYSGGSSSGGGESTPLHVLIMMVVFFVFISVIGAGSRIKQRFGKGPASRGSRNMDISAIRIGIDWRARKEVQARLTELAKSGQTNSPAGLASLLRETVSLLRGVELSWLYAEVQNFHPMSAASAEGIFRQIGTDARARFKEELLRNADGTSVTNEASERRAHPHEGEGVVVVTLVVAAKREIVDIIAFDEADHLKRLLDDLHAAANPSTLAAMEVIWSPSDENDRMSTAELEQHYPELSKIDEASIAGRVFCEYCAGPFAAELGECPHCGAPV